MAGLGSFAEGLMAGQQHREQRRLGKLRERAIEDELGDAGVKRAGRDAMLKEYFERVGLEMPQSTYESPLQDPWGVRAWGWLRSRFGGEESAAPSAPSTAGVATPRTALPAPGGAQQQAFSTDVDWSAMGYREGGSVTMSEEERIRELAERNRARDRRALDVDRATQERRWSGPQESAPQQTSRGSRVREAAGRTRDAALGRGPAPEGTGRARRMLRSGAGKAGVAGAGIGAALTGFDTPTEQYRERFGLMPSEREGIPRLLEDTAVRAGGVMSDLGNVLTLGQAGRFYRDLQENETPAPERTALPAPSPGPSAADQTVPQLTGRTAEQTVPQPQRRAVEPEAKAEEAMTPPIEEIDFSQTNASPDDIPDFSTRDWAEYRKRAVGYMMMQGMTEGEAHSAVSNMQQEGFMRYGQQALAHMQRGDLRSAATALKAAYQYFPDGSNARFGIQGDTLVGLGYDEQTGEQTRAMAITPERLSVMLENFSNPSAFRTWTRDWRAEEFQRRRYEEVEKPSAQARVEQGERQLDILSRRADADMAAARAKGAGGGVKQSDYRASYAAFSDMFNEAVPLDAEISAGDQRMLLDTMSRVRQRNPDQGRLSDATIFRVVMDAYEQDNMDAVFQLLEQ